MLNPLFLCHAEACCRDWVPADPSRLLYLLQERLRDKVHLQTVRILEREDALTPRMEEAGEEAPRHTPRPPTRGLSPLLTAQH